MSNESLKKLEGVTGFIDYWHEINDTIDKLIKLTYPITRDRLQKLKRLGSVDEQVDHIIEECVEFKQELLKAKYEKVDWKSMDIENLDMLFAWLALQHVISTNSGINRFALARTLTKFHEKGWLNFK